MPTEILPTIEDIPPVQRPTQEWAIYSHSHKIQGSLRENTLQKSLDELLQESSWKIEKRL